MIDCAAVYVLRALAVSQRRKHVDKPCVCWKLVPFAGSTGCPRCGTGRRGKARASCNDLARLEFHLPRAALKAANLLATLWLVPMPKGGWRQKAPINILFVFQSTNSLSAFWETAHIFRFLSICGAPLELNSFARSGIKTVRKRGHQGHLPTIDGTLIFRYGCIKIMIYCAKQQQQFYEWPDE